MMLFECRRLLTETSIGARGSNGLYCLDLGAISAACFGRDYCRNLDTLSPLRLASFFGEITATKSLLFGDCDFATDEARPADELFFEWRL